jgi:choline dehydrogenase-like flavoprotein
MTGPETTEGEYDYIVVGAGSAGCLLANRLSADATRRVLVLEAGGRDNWIWFHIPVGYLFAIGNPRSDWCFKTEPEEGLNGRSLNYPRGKAIGGSSSINAMIYMRGQAADYDHWRQLGLTGWGWDDVLPVFKRAEANERFAGPLHGTEGPLTVSDLRYRHPLSLVGLRAAQEAGYPYNDDFNGATQQGVGFYQTTMRDAERASTAAAYLRPVLGDAKLRVVTDAYVGAILTENGAAVGVRFSDKSGAAAEARARAEVILAAGTLATPKLLQLSGIGPSDHLAKLGIPVVRDMPEVGANFQDHLDVPYYVRIDPPISLLGEDKGLKAARHWLEYKLFRTGLLTSNVVDSGGFIDTTGSGRSDIQIHFIPQLLGDPPREGPPGHGLSINPAILDPKSRGTVRLRSSNPQDPIVFDPNFLSAPEDIAAFVRGIKVVRGIGGQPSLKRIGAVEISPMGEPLMTTDEQMGEHARKYAKSIYHPVGTCRMGSDDKAVVDPALRVRGVARLRVCDASVMPKIPRGNTNAPTIMIAERCADFVLGGR